MIFDWIEHIFAIFGVLCALFLVHMFWPSKNVGPGGMYPGL